MTEEKAASAATSDSRNLVMRIAVAAVLIPFAVATAWAGGWLWSTLVTLAAIAERQRISLSASIWASMIRMFWRETFRLSSWFC